VPIPMMSIRPFDHRRPTEPSHVVADHPISASERGELPPHILRSAIPA
jgi:hypothetical protein